MENVMAQAENFVLTPPPARLLYTNALIAPQPFRDKGGVQGAPRFNVQVLIPEDHHQIDALQTVILKAAFAEFPALGIKERLVRGEDVDAVYADIGKRLNFPLKYGADLADEAKKNGNDRPFYNDSVMVLMAQKPAKSRTGADLNPPRLVVLQNGQMVDYSEPPARALAKEFFYSGVSAVGSFQLKGYTGFGGGVTCYIDRLLSLNTGDHIQVGADDESVFGKAERYSEYMGTVSPVDPTSGMAQLDNRTGAANW
jgi:hypothetical protein